jgi:hypothetical protein
MSKIKFVRGFWGSEGDKKMEMIKSFLNRAESTDKALSPKLYVYGKENYLKLKDTNIECELMDDNPRVYDSDFRHKLEIMKKAIDEYGSCIFIDWHIVLKGDLPNDFYQTFQAGAPIKASLRMYRQRKAKWRDDDQRKIPCSDMIYISDTRYVDELIEMWESETGRKHSDVILMKYIDFLTGMVLIIIDNILRYLRSLICGQKNFSLTKKKAHL